MSSIEKGNYYPLEDNFVDVEATADINKIIARIKKSWQEESLPPMIASRERDIVERISHLQDGEKTQILLNNKKIIVKKINNGKEYAMMIKEI